MSTRCSCRVGLRCGERRKQLWLGPLQQGPGLRQGGPAEGLPPTVLLVVSAPPWEAGILVSRTSDAWELQEQVFLEPNLACELTGIDHCQAETCSVWILFSAFFSFQSQADTTTFPSLARASLEITLSAPYGLIWGFSPDPQIFPLSPTAVVCGGRKIMRLG